MSYEPMTQEQLDAIRARLEVRTSGPWRAIICESADHPPHGNGVIASGSSWPVVDDETMRVEDADLIAHAPQDLTDLLAEVERRGARPTVDDDMVERAKRAFGAATAQVSSIPLGMSEAMFIDSVGLQHQHAIRAAIDAALYHTATHSKEDQ